jgi:hypothetical protein
MKQEPLSQQYHSTNKVANIRSYESTRTGSSVLYCCCPHENVVTPMQAATSPILLYYM